MMNAKLGRNDPCHCGSGKKYKRCHMAQDERTPWAASPEAEPSPLPARARSGAPPSPSPPTMQSNPAEVLALLRRWRATRPKRERAKLDGLIAQAEQLAQALELETAAGEAGAALEAHREAYEHWAADPDAVWDRAREVFAEARFAPLRFTAEQVARACEVVRCPLALDATDCTVDRIKAAILEAATPEVRAQASAALLKLLPEFVAEERYLDGLLVLDCARDTVQLPEQSNAFLFHMFAHGWEAREAPGRVQRDLLAREFGVDLERLQDLSFEDLEARFAALEADPERRERVKALLLKDGGDGESMTEATRRIEHDARLLLERDDARPLFLSRAELAPWLPAWNAQVTQASCGRTERAPGAPLPSEQVKALVESLDPVLTDMVRALFTPERLQTLTEQLRTYRDERHRAGDLPTTRRAYVALRSLNQEPVRCAFLYSLCLISLAYAEEEPPPDPATETD